MVADVSLSWLVEMCADKSHWDWEFQSIAVYDSHKKKKKKKAIGRWLRPKGRWERRQCLYTRQAARRGGRKAGETGKQLSFFRKRVCFFGGTPEIQSNGHPVTLG